MAAAISNAAPAQNRKPGGVALRAMRGRGRAGQAMRSGPMNYCRQAGFLDSPSQLTSENPAHAATT